VPGFVRLGTKIVFYASALGLLGPELVGVTTDRWLDQLFVGGLVISILAVAAVYIADSLAWRLSKDYVPGLRKQKNEKAIQSSPVLRFFRRGVNWFGALTLIYSGLIVLFMLVMFGGAYLSGLLNQA
jgi:hypothetical protein